MSYQKSSPIARGNLCNSNKITCFISLPDGLLYSKTSLILNQFSDKTKTASTRNQIRVQIRVQSLNWFRINLSTIAHPEFGSKQQFIFPLLVTLGNNRILE